MFAERQSEKQKEKIKGVEVDKAADDVDTMISEKENKNNMSKYFLQEGIIF